MDTSASAALPTTEKGTTYSHWIQTTIIICIVFAIAYLYHEITRIKSEIQMTKSRELTIDDVNYIFKSNVAKMVREERPKPETITVSKIPTAEEEEDDEDAAHEEEIDEASSPVASPKIQFLTQ